VIHTTLPDRWFVRFIIFPGLLAFFLYSGLLPALTRLDSDFPNYYTASRLVLQGSDVSRLYDDRWFQERMQESGIQQPGKFSPFPPPTALSFLPLALVQPLTALRIMTILNCGLLVASIYLLARCFNITALSSSIFIFASGIGLSNCFRLGQLYVVLSFTILLGYYFYRNNRPLLAGACFGIFIPIKYFPIVFLVYFALLKEWRLIGVALSVAFVECAISIGALGWKVHEVFLTSVLGQHLLSNFTQQNSFSSTFQSWDSLLRRLFLFDPVLNPVPVLDSAQAYIALKIVIISSLTAICIMTIKKINRGQPETKPLIFALLGLFALLLAPGTGTYHYIMLWTPMAILLMHFIKETRLKLFYVTLMLYIMIGFLPYGLLHGFEGKGLLSTLSYPRLYLTLALFLIASFGAIQRPGQTLVSPP
jgi:hypothetical protein